MAPVEASGSREAGIVALARAVASYGGQDARSNLANRAVDDQAGERQGVFHSGQMFVLGLDLLG